MSQPQNLQVEGEQEKETTVPHSPVFVGQNKINFPVYAINSPKSPPNKAREATKDLSTLGYPLQTKWTFWFDKKTTASTAIPTTQREAQEQTAQYRNQLSKLGSFETIDQFTKLYAYLATPSSLGKNVNYHMFRHEIVPMWESYPQGGCWMVKIKKNGELVDRLWEQLVFATICEEFQEPNVVGIVLSMRPREDVLSVWNRDSSNQRAKLAIGERFKEILHLGTHVVIQYKHNKLSIKDGSTFRNAKNYIVAEDQAA
ncbi:translation initiation factor 4E [Acrasis kona]|uniref:Translation initiation factor 4E n=1 Tax=Acrasis kona TaxID=1008807 RepID=A0AAW2ZBF5_9EUKA